MDNYETERILARGTFGMVYLCHLKKDVSSIKKKQVVIKQIPLEVLKGVDRITTLNEAHVLSMLKHPNIIQYYDSFFGGDDATSMFMVMEYAPGGTLFDLIEKKHSSRVMGERKNLNYFQG